MTLAFPSGQSATEAPYLEERLRYLPDAVRKSLSTLQAYLNKTAASASHNSSLASTIGSLVLSLHRSLHHRLPYLLASPIAVAATLLAVLLALFTIMTSWRRWPSIPSMPSMLRDITSPLSSIGGVLVPRVREGDYEYVTPEEVRSSTEQRPKDPRYSPNQQYPNDEEDVGPDVIVLKCRDVFYPLRFQPYAIADGILTIGALRRAAGHALAVERLRRIKLLYKGRLLKDDNVTARSVNLKQRSEVLCVITDTYGLPDSASESSESDTARRLKICDVPWDGSKGSQEDDKPEPAEKSRSSKKRNRRKKRQQPAQPELEATTQKAANQPPANNSPAMARPTPKPSSPPDTRQTQTQATRPPVNKTPATSNKPPSKGNQPPNGRPSGSPRTVAKIPSPSPIMSPKKPAKENLDLLEEYFESVIVPLGENYIRDPPSTVNDRTKEYRLISETTMTQLMLKADDVEIDGDAKLRQQRKALIMKAQLLLNRVDGVPKL